MRCREASRGLPEQERRNCRSEFEQVPGRGGFHIRSGENESRPAVGTATLTDRTHATIYVPWAEGMTEDMVKKGARAFVQAEETVRLFWRAFSLEEANVSFG